MLNLLNLIELKNFGNPFFPDNKILLGADIMDVFAESIKVDWDIVLTREDISEKAKIRRI